MGIRISVNYVNDGH